MQVDQNKSVKRRRLLWATFGAMVLGVVTGWILDCLDLPPDMRMEIVTALNTVTHLFLRLIRMIVAPLILSILMIGISQMDGAGSVGKVGLRSLGWFLMMSSIAILTGLLLANLFSPGESLSLTLPTSTAAAPAAAPFSVAKAIEELAPTSIIDAMASNRIIQIVVFAVFAGLALGSLGPRAAGIRDLAEQVIAVMLKIAGYVMSAAPLAVFAALASTTLEHGIEAIAVLGKLVAQFYLGLAVMAFIIVSAGALVVGGRIIKLLKSMREPLLIAFSTASSEATYPLTLEALRRFGVSPRISGLVLPLGYAFNLDGTLVYSAFTVVFIAQAYGIDMPLMTQLGVMLFLLLANKGAAGVPRGALVGLTITLQTFDIPVAGVALILGVDALMDMGRTTINVLGNSVATAAIAKMDGEDLGKEESLEPA